jgi:hypothetical protein
MIRDDDNTRIPYRKQEAFSTMEVSIGTKVSVYKIMAESQPFSIFEGRYGIDAPVDFRW